MIFHSHFARLCVRVGITAAGQTKKTIENKHPDRLAEAGPIYGSRMNCAAYTECARLYMALRGEVGARPNETRIISPHHRRNQHMDHPKQDEQQ